MPAPSITTASAGGCVSAPTDSMRPFFITMVPDWIGAPDTVTIRAPFTAYARSASAWAASPKARAAAATQALNRTLDVMAALLLAREVLLVQREMLVVESD